MLEMEYSWENVKTIIRHISKLGIYGFMQKMFAY